MCPYCGGKWWEWTPDSDSDLILCRTCGCPTRPTPAEAGDDA